MCFSDFYIERIINCTFLYTYLQDNCDADIDVDVVVKSNEIQQDKNDVAELFKTCRDGSVEQAQLLFAPTQ